jgi:hypothetical protein
MDAPQTTIIEHLDDAWAVERACGAFFAEMLERIDDFSVRLIIEEQDRMCYRHEENVEARLRALGLEPRGEGGTLHDDTLSFMRAPRSARGLPACIHALIKCYAVCALKTALYQAIASAAIASSDYETADMARQHLQQSREMMARSYPFLAPLASNLARGDQDKKDEQAPVQGAMEALQTPPSFHG